MNVIFSSCAAGENFLTAKIYQSTVEYFAYRYVCVYVDTTVDLEIFAAKKFLLMMLSNKN